MYVTTRCTDLLFAGEWSVISLSVLLVVYHLLATWTYGLSVSSGVFIPSLFTGAVWGRMLGTGILAVWPGSVRIYAR